jgi:hypothetical protein
LILKFVSNIYTLHTQKATGIPQKYMQHTKNNYTGFIIRTEQTDRNRAKRHNSLMHMMMAKAGQNM